MSESIEVDIRDIVLSNGSFGPQEIRRMLDVISNDTLQAIVMRDAVAELETVDDRTPASSVRLGVCQYLLGKYRDAIETLSKADGGALTHFFRGKSCLEISDWERAISSFESSAKAGYNLDECHLAVVGAQRMAGQAETAIRTLDNLSGAIEQTAEYLYQRGATVAALNGNLEEICALYQRAIDVDPDHSGALFGLALENDRRGNDPQAMDLYHRACSQFPAHVGSLLNLGLLYEDGENYQSAKKCYERVLDSFPNHDRARLYLMDVLASGDMYYDEEADKKRDRLTQVLGSPVSDFELSLRSRNCLQKMGIYTLGDLTKCSEQELLASKNFGESSLVEIRDMLVARGLAIGQFAHEGEEPEPSIDIESMSPDEQALLERPMSELNLSVRARKCMARLGLNTIGQLIRKTGDELLQSKNFGVTSLIEVREKLAQFGLKLRGD